MQQRTLYHLCSLQGWEGIEERGYIGFGDDGPARTPLPTELTFLTEDCTGGGWFRTRGTEVVITVAVPAMMVQPWLDFLSKISQDRRDREEAMEKAASIASLGDPQSWLVAPRTIPSKFWRLVQSRRGDVLWMPVRVPVLQ